MKADVEDNLIEVHDRNSVAIESEINDFLVTDEGQKIKEDIDLLKSMGFNKKMINKVYILLRPENIERAIDYMTEIDGVYQHDFIAGSNPKEQNLCFICKKPKRNHLDFIPEDLLNNAQNNIPNNDPFIDNLSEEDIIQENNNKNKDDDAVCDICYDDLTEEDKKLNAIPCGHLYCFHCWFNYFKTLILEAKVENIKCMDHECKEIITEEFILQHIYEDENLIGKYHKFKKRAEILKDKNKRICPNPDCDSYLQKSKSSKYVKCENGHQYCFECLKPPHGKRKCEINLEKQFMKWTKGKRVKQCPKCKMYTEKNAGCNHMTCVSCKYQWCWLCEGGYKYDHYSSGKCKGQQFTRADNLKEIEKIRNAFGIHKIFKCVYEPVNGPFDIDEYLWVKYLLMLGFLIFGYGAVFGFGVFFYLEKNLKIEKESNETIFIVMTVLIGLTLLVVYQITFSCIMAPFILIAFIYHRFFDRILVFFGIGENDRM